MKNLIRDVYILLGEEQGDLTMEAKGVVILMANGQFRVYSIGSDHNRLRVLLNRHDWKRLELGVQTPHGEFRLDRKTDEMEAQGWTQAASIPRILRALRQQYQRHLFFLDKHIASLL